MVMGEVSLRRVKELLLGVAPQLRPTLAIGDPAVLSVDWCHRLVVCGRGPVGAAGMVRRSLLVAVTPGSHVDRNVPGPPLAIRFHNVAGTGSRG